MTVREAELEPAERFDFAVILVVMGVLIRGFDSSA